ncbi:hypothetical protein P8605_08705 [Streptomyces sp. T-3]|nr:hypothetical protein [Streptomyces sp. T-3]
MTTCNELLDEAAYFDNHIEVDWAHRVASGDTTGMSALQIERGAQTLNCWHDALVLPDDAGLEQEQHEESRTRQGRLPAGRGQPAVPDAYLTGSGTTQSKEDR